jgi:hypothetical protein
MSGRFRCWPPPRNDLDRFGETIAMTRGNSVIVGPVFLLFAAVTLVSGEYSMSVGNRSAL